jgi:hypothetical protein
MAHLHLLLATEVDEAVLLKHGPGRSSCVLGWDRRTDEVALGQCLRSKVEFLDLSPDGEYLAYGVNKHRYRVENSVYFAISRPPWLKALTFWGGDGQFGTNPSTGCFCRSDDGALCLLVFGEREPQWNELGVRTTTTRPSAWGGFLRGSLLFDRLQRDGWSATSEFEVVDQENAGDIAKWRDRRVHRALFRKSLLYGWALEQTHWVGLNSDSNRGVAFETFAIVSPSGCKSACKGWVSADWDAARERVVWTTDDRLFGARLGIDGLGEARLIYDASDIRFVARKAPY